MVTIASSDEQWIGVYSERLRTCIGGSGRILELGCGTGRDTIHLVQLGEVVCIDINKARLQQCHDRAPQAVLIRGDLAHDLPIRSESFSAVIASLSLHYFSWKTTVRLVGEIRRIMSLGGLLIVRVNSIRDINYGAVGHPEIEPHLYQVGDRQKRFFGKASILELFDGWNIEAMEERTIMRYEKPKRIWQLSLYAA